KLFAEPRGLAHTLRLAGIWRRGHRPRRPLDAHVLRRPQPTHRAHFRSLSDVPKALRANEGQGKPAEHSRGGARRLEESAETDQRGGPPDARTTRVAGAPDGKRDC